MYKRKPGYTLKKGASGEKRWHKIKKSTPEYRKRGGGDSPDFTLAKRLFPGIQASAFIITPEMKNLSVDPDTFHGNGNRLILGSPEGVDKMLPHDIMYHGTRYKFDQFNDDAAARPVNTGHWNNSLGNHFTPSRDVAEDFANGSTYPALDIRGKRFQSSQPGETGKVLQVTANVRNPLLVSDETALDAYAAAFMMNNTLTDKELEAYDYETGYDYGAYAKRLRGIRSIPDARKEQELAKRLYLDVTPREMFDVIYPGGRRSGALSEAYLKVISAGRRFKEERLEKMGFDGYVYDNVIEGGIGVAPFSTKQLQYVETDSRRSAIDILNNDKPRTRYADSYIQYEEEMNDAINEIDAVRATPRKDRPRIQETSSFATINKMRRMNDALIQRTSSRDGAIDTLFNQIRSTRKLPGEQ